MFLSTLKLYSKTQKFCTYIAFQNGAAETAVHAQVVVMFVVQPVAEFRALSTETVR
jgi:hypothetical protein